MSEIKTIPTIYKGITFRSRLEARWAYYFDLIKLKWFYEDEGFILDDGTYYLPDFHIPGFGYVEIKPEGGDTPEAIEKCRLLSKFFSTAIFVGPPSLKAQTSFENGEEVSTMLFNSYSVRKWGQIPYYGSWDETDSCMLEPIELANAKRWGNG